MLNATILVTGAAGFIGHHVSAALIARGADVVGVDSFDPFYDRALKERNVADLELMANRAGTGRFRLIPCDIAEPADLQRVFAQTTPRGVIHLAGKAGVRPSLRDPLGYVRANITGTMAMLEACRMHGVERMLLASSSSVYGNNTKVPFAEDDPVDHPISPYAATKKACELLAHTHWTLHKMPVGCLRFFTVFGPRQRPDLAIAAFMRMISKGEPISVFGDGSMRRDFTYVDDIVAGVLAAYERISDHGYRVWNLGSDRPVRLDAMVREVGQVVGRDPIIKAMPMQPGDVDATWADLTRVRTELGYAPKTAFREGLERQWAWARQLR